MLPNIHEKDYRVVDLVRQREIQDSITYTVSQKLHVTQHLISRLGLEKELVGHSGCVNCLEWNESGQILASASDDMNIILWDPFRCEKKQVLRTGHQGNIFSVKFMPKSNDRILVSGASDGKVQIRDLTLLEPMFSCSCHKCRVKRIATASTEPFLFWSAAEDGFILQYDIRAPHSCKSNDHNSVLVDLDKHMGRYSEAKCIAVNPKKTELIAVGANDPYIRMYDRRMIKLSQMPDFSSLDGELSQGIINTRRSGENDPDENIPLGSAQYFIAGHLHTGPRSTKSLSTTYLTFSADGNELLVNMGGEQIYLFDVNNPKKFKTCFGYASNTYLGECGTCCLDNVNEDIMDYTKKNIKILPPHVEELKRQANESFEKKEYTLAINLYNKAISLCPSAAVLYANRATAYMRRMWGGDIYAAHNDCQTTLLLDPGHVKSYYRLARCLHDLCKYSEAEKVMKKFQQRFPEYESNSACETLKMHIKKSIDTDGDNDLYQTTCEISEYEQEWRRNTIDYKMRFCGHCNTTTDIKEANFFGNGQYIVAGSDDGSFFIWDRSTTNIIRVLKGDKRIVNCLQPHPSTCLLATSGIDPVVRLWSPLPEDGTVNEREIQDLENAASANQILMDSNPLELELMNMSYRYLVEEAELNEDSDDPLNDSDEPLNCRLS